MSGASPTSGWPAMSIAQAHAILTGPGTVAEVVEAEVHGVRIKVWKNLPPTLGSVVELARTHGEATFLVHEDERVSYEAFYRAVGAFARELQAAGVRKGDRVALAMRNLPEWVVCAYGAAVAGAIATPLNAWWTGPELEYGLADSGARVLIVDAERYGRLAEHLRSCPALERIYVSREADEIAHPLVVRLEDVLGEPGAWERLPDQPLPDAGLGTDDDAALFYTSGTTGKPKGAVCTHRGINGNIFTSGVAVARAYLRRGEAPPTPDPADPQWCNLVAVPFFHVTGFIAMLNPAMARGAKLVMMRRWDTERALQLIERERVTQTGGVPTIAWQILEHPDRAKYDLSSLQLVAYGGAPSAPELVRRLKSTFAPLWPANGWGMTETSGTVTTHGFEDYQNRPDSCGPPVPVFELQIREPADGVTVLPTGEVGELWTKGPIARGYWNKPQATAETFVDGWLRTGDLARLDEEGFCYIVDRAKDMLIRGGENIYCIEVENVLYDHPAVMDAAVVGVAHKTLGEEPGAVVVLKPGASVDEAELRAHVAERLAAFKVPVAVRFLPETLPRNANGKVLKNELKQLFA